MKKCEHCAEEIQDEAKKCRHCGEPVVTKPPAADTVGIDAKLIPAGILHAGEKLLLETRQDTNVYFAVIGIFFFLSLFCITTSPAVPITIGFILFLMWLSWKNKIYVITDRRLLTLKGVLSKAQVEFPIHKIQNTRLQLRWGYGKTGIILFDTASGPLREMTWVNIKDADQVVKKISHLIHQ